MNTLPSYTLEVRAVDERRRLQSSIAELRSRVREKLDIKREIRQSVFGLSGAVTLFALLLGGGFTLVLASALRRRGRVRPACSSSNPATFRGREQADADERAMQYLTRAA
jgi:hypothetical protein